MADLWDTDGEADSVEEDVRHIDLFSGIGGFALAAQQVWENYETTLFCDCDKFCQRVLRKRFPNVPIYDDIRTLSRERFIADTHSNGQSGDEAVNADQGREQTQCNVEASRRLASIDLITGGFPCQPFSQAGKRKGTDDNRYLWPEMLRVISDFKPTWVIAENVRGILTIEGGLVFEQVCLDLEREDYEVQPIIIPACAVNAPHRRDRVWFVAHSKSDGGRGKPREVRQENGRQDDELCIGIKNADFDAQNTLCERGNRRSQDGRQVLERGCPKIEAKRSDSESGDGSNTNSKGWQGGGNKNAGRLGLSCGNGSNQGWAWSKNWPEVATKFCVLDDGLPASVDGLELSKSRHRVERLKSLGNSIVPQVAMEIMKAIKFSEVI